MSTSNGKPAAEQPQNENDIPEDLRYFRDRMAERGITVRLPKLDGTYKLPRPMKIKGESLSDTVIRMRRGEL
jgi:hypothetical protein